MDQNLFQAYVERQQSFRVLKEEITLCTRLVCRDFNLLLTYSDVCFYCFLKFSCIVLYRSYLYILLHAGEIFAMNQMKIATASRKQCRLPLCTKQLLPFCALKRVLFHNLL